LPFTSAEKSRAPIYRPSRKSHRRKKRNSSHANQRYQHYKEGYSVVTREDLARFYYYQPAVQRVSVVDVKVPKDLKVGYIMGAGDEIRLCCSRLAWTSRCFQQRNLPWKI